MSILKDADLSDSELDALPIVGAQPKNEREEEYLKEIRTFEFTNLEEPGLMLTFPYGDTRRKKNFKFLHSQKYRVPRHVARHLENCTTPIWDYRPDGMGRMTKQKVGTKSRFQMREVFE